MTSTYKKTATKEDVNKEEKMNPKDLKKLLDEGIETIVSPLIASSDEKGEPKKEVYWHVSSKHITATLYADGQSIVDYREAKKKYSSLIGKKVSVNYTLNDKRRHTTGILRGIYWNDKKDDKEGVYHPTILPVLETDSDSDVYFSKIMDMVMIE